jgi:hypothetical protein
MELVKDTQKDYRKYSNKALAVFGKMLPDNIRPEHVRKYMGTRGTGLTAGGQKQGRRQ